MKQHLSPYPNQGEIIRYLASALDLKAGNKEIDEYARKGDMDHQQRSRIIDEVFYGTISRSLGQKTASFFRMMINQLLDNYLELVKTISLDGMPRAVALPLLVNHYFSWQATDFLFAMEQSLAGPSPACFVITGASAVKVIIEWFEDNIKDWRTSYSIWTKEQKDSLQAWCKGDRLPSYTSVMALSGWLKDSGARLDDDTANNMRCLLLIARAAEYIKKTDLGNAAIESTRICLWTTSDCINMGTPLSTKHIEYNKKYDGMSKMALPLNHSLSLQREKAVNAQAATKQQLIELKRLQKKVDPVGLTDYYLNWLEAKWHVFAGDLKEALVFYKKAFEQSLYCAGENQRGIIEQAIVVAAKMKDKPFLKRLKNQAIVFGWFVAPSQDDDNKINNQKSRSRSNVVEDWEVEAFGYNLTQLFPEKYLFAGCRYQSPGDNDLPFLFVDIEAVKPDYARPDRQIKIGETKKKTTPQLVWFAEREKLNIVEKLLDKGASVNVHSQSGDTPILIAVQSMNVIVPFLSLNERCFNMIAALAHQPEIINMRTTKRKLMPLICAVYSGKLVVIQQLLEMGAEVDRRGGTDSQTALNHAIGLIGKRLKPENFAPEFKKHFANPTTAALESMRRLTYGLTGFTLEHQKSAMENMQNSESFQHVMEDYCRLYIERITKELSLTELRKIVHALIDAGADPDAENDAVIKGCTPLMLAAEFDEVDIFERMLAAGGSPFKYCYFAPQSRNIDCWAIAINFGSSRVLALLKLKYPAHRFYG